MRCRAGLPVDCKEFQERISSAVDRRLSRQEKEQFEEHSGRCPTCRQEYEDECSTKTLLRERTRMVHVPPDLQVAIAREIEREAGIAESSQGRLRAVVRTTPVRVAFAFALTAVLVIVFLARRSEPSENTPVITAGLSANNVIRQSVDDFHRILRGELAPQVASAESVELQDFFTGKTSFPVLVPHMRECTLVGGIIQEYNGMRLPHIVYRAGDDVISVYQACWESVQEGRTLDLAPEAKAAILKRGWYTPAPAGNDAVVLWRQDRTLCVAVSHMGLDRLLSSVRSGADSTLP